MDRVLPQKLRSKPNIHQRPLVHTLAGSIFICLNVVWTLSLMYLTWFKLSSRENGTLSELRDGQFPDHDMQDTYTHGSFSPILKPENLAKVTKTMNGRLKDSTSIYRQPPSPEVDQAWAETWHSGESAFNVTASDLRNAGYNPDDLVAWNDIDDAYPVSFEYTHLIHCLDHIRQEMWHEHYFPPTADQTPQKIQIRREHGMHCVHMLLQDLTCHAELDLVPLVWMPYSYGRAGNQYAPTGMFSTKKECRDIDAADRWLRDHHIADLNPMLADLKPLPNAKLFDDDGYWAD